MLRAIYRGAGWGLRGLWLAPHGDFVGIHLRVAAQQPAASFSAMSDPEFIAMYPGVEGFLVLPTRDHHDLVRVFGAQDLHRDEAGERLHETPSAGESFDDLVGHAFFHRQPVDDGEHAYLQTSSG